MKKSISAGGIVLNDQNEIVLVQSQAGNWGFPKGHVEEKESLLEAAKREIFEETGLKEAVCVRELGSYNRFTNNDPSTEDLKIIHLFFFTSERFPVQPHDPDNPAAKWVKMEDVEDQLSFEVDRDFWKKIKNTLL